jgi:hypothetical protein
MTRNTAKATVVLVTMSLCQGCIATGALMGGLVGTLAPIGIAADRETEVDPKTVLLCGFVGASLGALFGILSVEDRKTKPKKEPPPDDEPDEPDG